MKPGYIALIVLVLCAIIGVVVYLSIPSNNNDDGGWIVPNINHPDHNVSEQFTNADFIYANNNENESIQRFLNAYGNDETFNIPGINISASDFIVLAESNFDFIYVFYTASKLGVDPQNLQKIIQAYDCDTFENAIKFFELLFDELLETDFRFAETYNKVLDAFLEVDVDEIDVIAEEVKYVKTDVLNDEVQFLFEKIGKLESQVEKLNQELIDIKRFNIQPRNQETKVYNCSEGISNLTY